MRAAGEGARLLTGGERPAGLARGHFLEPTVLDRVRHGSSPTREEVFGPVAAIVRVRDVDEAIALANDSDYGLGANIYTNNLRYVMQAMEEIKAGTFWVNDPLTDNEAGPFGGMRQSGIGRELGEEGLDAFREPKHVHIDYIQERKSYWFPYARPEVVRSPWTRCPLVHRRPVRERRRLRRRRSSTPRPARRIAHAAARHARARPRPRSRAARAAFDRGAVAGAHRDAARPVLLEIARRLRESARRSGAARDREHGQADLRVRVRRRRRRDLLRVLRRARHQDHRRREPGPRRRAEPDAQGAGRRVRADHPVELSAADGGVEDRARRCAPAAPWCSSRPRRRRSPRSSWRASSTGSRTCRRAWSTS